MITLDLPPDVEQAYRAEAEARGVSLNDFLSEVLVSRQPNAKTVFEQGSGLFGSPEDSALLDEVVAMAYEERRRPARTSSVL